ncbi:ankyrin repeat domain-containing protein [Maribacter arenosus]|uniref:Ankyrin repeat domain-containing protein n=2 Tax=Maribacter arenosus TaxID=1854708 RepID=A0ABR7VKB2_9FLAO|nr:ankyrin repeat domain-containing protein [Maribacter arenosus]
MLKHLSGNEVYIYSNTINHSSISTGFCPVQKTIIMKRTVLIAATAFMFVCTTVLANNQNQIDYSKVNPISFEKAEISALCKAIVKGDIELVKKLISLGEDVNRKSLGKTPAIFAARYNKGEILKLLIDNGADLTIKSDSGYTITEIAKSANAKEALEIISSAMQS